MAFLKLPFVRRMVILAVCDVLLFKLVGLPHEAGTKFEPEHGNDVDIGETVLEQVLEGTWNVEFCGSLTKCPDTTKSIYIRKICFPPAPPEKKYHCGFDPDAKRSVDFYRRPFMCPAGNIRAMDKNLEKVFHSLLPHSTNVDVIWTRHKNKLSGVFNQCILKSACWLLSYRDWLEIDISLVVRSDMVFSNKRIIKARAACLRGHGSNLTQAMFLFIFYFFLILHLVIYDATSQTQGIAFLFQLHVG